MYVLSCDCRFRWERNLFSHMLHLNSLVLIVWMVLCFFRLSSVAKVWLHSSHFWFFINLCLGKVIFLYLLFLCFIRLLWKIGSLQISHWTFSSCDEKASPCWKVLSNKLCSWKLHQIVCYERPQYASTEFSLL